jgi:hypothetical protein
LGGRIRAVKENAEALVVAAKEIGFEVNADKTKYMVMSRDQNAGRNHSMKTDNSFFERVDKFKYLGKTLTNQNSFQEKIKIRLKSGNACYRSVQNLLSSSLLSKNIQIKAYRSAVFLLFCNSVKLGPSKKKNITQLPLLTRSRNYYTCNQTLKMKRKDNFNDIENVFCETTNLFP